MIEDTPSKKPIVVIALVTAVCLLGNEMLFIVLPIYWEFFGLNSLWQVGILLSANRIIRIPLNSLVGFCYQRTSKRTGLMIAVILAVISTFSYGVLKGFWLLLFARCIWGISWSFFRLGGYLTIISCSDSKTRGQYVGLYNGLWGLGTLFGMLLGGFFSDLIGIQTVTTLFSVMGACSLPFIVKHVPHTKTIEVRKNFDKKNTLVIWKDKRVVSAFITGLVVAFAVYGVFTSTFSKIVEFHIDQKMVILGFSIGAASLTGIFQAIRTGWEPFLAPYLGKCSDLKWGRIPILILGLLTASLCFAVFPLDLSVGLFIGMILLFQLTSTLLITMSDTIAADLTESQSHVTIIALYTLFSDVGAALGPLISFIIMDEFGVKWSYWLTSFIILPLGIYWIICFKKEQPKRIYMSG
jgi:MFS family permease